MKLIKFFTKKEGDTCLRAYINIYRLDPNNENTLFSFGIALYLPFINKMMEDFDNVSHDLKKHGLVLSLYMRFRTKQFSPHRFLLKTNRWYHA